MRQYNRGEQKMETMSEVRFNDTEERRIFEVTEEERRIVEVTEEQIIFDDDSYIWWDHYQDCCEHTYADLENMDDAALDYVFKGKITFESVPGSGFRFGDSRRMFFVPCYSIQNGYYSSYIDVGWSCLDDNGDYDTVSRLDNLKCKYIYRDGFYEDDDDYELD